MLDMVAMPAGRSTSEIIHFAKRAIARQVPRSTFLVDATSDDAKNETNGGKQLSKGNHVPHTIHLVVEQDVAGRLCLALKRIRLVIAITMRSKHLRRTFCDDCVTNTQQVRRFVHETSHCVRRCKSMPTTSVDKRGVGEFRLEYRRASIAEKLAILHLRAKSNMSSHLRSSNSNMFGRD